MSDLQKNFNKSATDDPRAVLKRDVERLSAEKRDLYNDHEKLWDRDREAHKNRQLEERPLQVAHHANRATNPPGATLGLGPAGHEPLILSSEVEAMMERGRKLGLELDQVAPANHREKLILKGWHDTREFEQKQTREFELERFESCRKLVDNLLVMEMGREDPGKREVSRDDRTLSDEFNRVR